ncbi:MAG: DegT/DnrJ/EryC1/StrS family aminotransferase [Acidimicrobiales bacterium]
MTTLGPDRILEAEVPTTATRRGADLALAGGHPLFDVPRSASNLAAPDVERFLAYSRRFYDARRYTNTGPLSVELERRLAQLHDVEHCVTFASGFWALVLALRALALPGRDQVVLPSLTYRRMADVARWASLVPRFCDVDPGTLAIDASTVEPCLGPETAVVLAVHPIVNCCAVDDLEDLATSHHLPLLVDGVESCYETFHGRKVGSFGNAEVFSLHASKLVNGFEGGYLTTDDGDLAGKLALQRGFGFNGHDNVEHFGINAKLNEVHAAMALANLDELEEQVADHRRRYHAYRRALAGIPGLRLLAFDESEQTSCKNIVVELLDDWPLRRALTLELLQAEGILARAYYAPALHQRPTAYRTVAGPLPVTERLAERFVLLPSGSRVSLTDVAAIGRLLRYLATSGAAVALAGGDSTGAPAVAGAHP